VLGVCEMLDYPQGHPSARHGDLPGSVLIEALNNREESPPLCAKER
jgi:hypothetical protein